MNGKFHTPLSPWIVVDPPVIAPGETAYAVMKNPHNGDCIAPIPEPGVVEVAGHAITVLFIDYSECPLEDPYQTEYRYPISGLAAGVYEVQLLFCTEHEDGSLGCGVTETHPLLVSQSAAAPVPALGLAGAGMLAATLMFAAAWMGLRVARH